MRRPALNQATMRLLLPLKFSYAVFKVRAEIHRDHYPSSAEGGASIGHLIRRGSAPQRKGPEPHRDKLKFITKLKPCQDPRAEFLSGGAGMEASGLEPLTYCVQSSRSPS